MTMAERSSVVAVYGSHIDAENAVKDLQRSRFPMAQLSIVGKDYQTEENVVGYYNTGDRMKYWGKLGAFWGGLWGLLIGAAFFWVPGVGPVLVAGPLVAWIVAALEGAVVVGGLSALGAALYSIGIPRNSILQYETSVEAGKYLLVGHGTEAEVTRARDPAVISGRGERRPAWRRAPGGCLRQSYLRGATQMEDRELQHMVLEGLESEPLVRSSEIGVAVNEGVVTLSGIVETYLQQRAAGRVAQRVAGVRAVANDLQVRVVPGSDLTDTGMAQAAARKLEPLNTPDERVRVTVRDGWITLEGKVGNEAEQTAAIGTVHALPGVKGVTSRLVVTTGLSPAEVYDRIEEALWRLGELDARQITVDVTDSRVVLLGRVRSPAEREAAEEAARQLKGVEQVANYLAVRP
jgi:osmotically-inducible protein OsmY